MNPRPEFFKTWRPHWVTRALGSPFMDFRTYHGAEGLAEVKGDALDILAIATTKPGTGQLRRFIEEAKSRFSVITFWALMNEDMLPILCRYGFGPCLEGDKKLDGTPTTIEGMRWKKSEAPSFTCPKCKRTSYHASDIANSYCGACHEFFGVA